MVVQANGGTNDMSIWKGLISGRVSDVAEILLSLTTVKEVMVSMGATVHQSRVLGLARSSACR